MKNNDKALIILPSNFGDILLTLKAIELIKNSLKQIEICALASPSTAKFVDSLGFFNKVDIFDKNWSLSNKYKYLSTFRNKYYFCFDFKHSLVPFIVNSRRHTPMLRFAYHGHKSDYYLDLVNKTLKADEKQNDKFEKYIPRPDSTFSELLENDKYIFIAAGSKSGKKRYPAQKWADFINRLDTTKKFVFIGAKEDNEIVGKIIKAINENKKDKVVNLIAKTSFIDLFYLLSNYASVILGCDSAPMHVASYVDIPTIALFGPTDPVLYGPRSSKKIVIQSAHGTKGKMSDIEVEEILNAYEELK